jgi:hypothetical protein
LKRKTPRGTTEHEARLEWKRAPDHRSWYLASLHDKRSNGTIAVPITFHLTVDDYDNTRVPAPKVFTQAHLISLLPDTTYIRDEVEKKRYYKKKRPHVDAERSFDDLARELNSAGYLRGDR